MFELLQGAQSGDNDDTAVVEKEEEGAAEAGEEGKIVAAPNQVWDEEDEIEQYFKEKSENGRGDEESDSDSGSDSDEDYAGGTAAMLGDNPTLDDINAETQRILRGILRSCFLQFTFVNSNSRRTDNSLFFFFLRRYRRTRSLR